LSAKRELPPEVTARFAKNVRELREKSGLSTAEIGFRAGFHPTQLAKLESGDRICRGDTLLKLATVLSVPVAALFEGIEWKAAERSTHPRKGDMPGRFEVQGPSRPTPHLDRGSF
jgi:transcriptional regulator with XRE-family HTH domain